MVHLEWKEERVNDLIEFLQQKHSSIGAQISTLLKEQKDIFANISQLRQAIKLQTVIGIVGDSKDNNRIGPISESEVYSSDWAWGKKIAFAIKEAGKAITTKEIVEVLGAYELMSDEKKRSAISSVSSTVSVKSGKYEDRKDFIKSVSATGEFAYEIWEEKTSNNFINVDVFGNVVRTDGLPF